MREKMQKGSVIGLILMAMFGILLGGAVLWNCYFNTPFQNITMELGSAAPQLSAFIKDGQTPKNPRFETDLDALDLTKTGEYAVSLRSATASQTVTLTVVDTTAPSVVFQDILADRETALTPEMFIAEASDNGRYTAAFAQEPTVSQEDEQTQVTLIVTDDAGNCTEGQCTVTYMWMRPQLTLELGNPLTKDMVLLNPQRDGELLDQEQLLKIANGKVGTYTISATKGDTTCQCEITVEDTTAPVLKLKEVKIDSNQKLSIEQFVSKATDASGEVSFQYQEKPDHTKEGTYQVVIIATDPNGNTTQAETTLKVSYDTTAPSFSGVSAMTVKRGSTPNYTKGVKAKDSRDGEVKFTVDTSRVNTDKTGTYYAIYTATDSSGNTATYRRKITVGHGPEDTKELVRSVAAKLSNDPVAICKWVANNISYGNSKTSDWGGDDPVWQGLKNKRGNCYVHALCLQRLLTEHGYKTKLIWVTNKTHYWLIVDMGGYWRHIDATPSSLHSRYPFMTDQQRLETLSGREWDTSLWPACE